MVPFWYARLVIMPYFMLKQCQYNCLEIMRISECDTGQMAFFKNIFMFGAPREVHIIKMKYGYAQTVYQAFWSMYGPRCFDV